MRHIDQATLQRWLGDELDLTDRTAVAEHIAACDQCTSMMAALMAEDAMFEATLALSTEDQAWVAEVPLKESVMAAVAPWYVRWQSWLILAALTAVGAWMGQQVLDLLGSFALGRGPVGMAAELLRLTASGLVRFVLFVAQSGSPVLFGTVLLIGAMVWLGRRAKKEVHDHA